MPQPDKLQITQPLGVVTLLPEVTTPFSSLNTVDICAILNDGELDPPVLFVYEHHLN